MKRFLGSRELPTIAILTLGSLVFAFQNSGAVAALLGLAAVLAIALQRARLGEWWRRGSAALSGLAIAFVALTFLPWSSDTLITLLLGAAGWLKLAERSGARDRFVAAMAGLWLVALGLIRLPPDAALLVIALTLASLVWALFCETPGTVTRLKRLAWLGTVAPALVLAILLFLFTPRITGNLGMLAFVLDLPFVIETEEEAQRKPPREDMALEEFQDTGKSDMRVLVADFSLGTGPFEKTAPPMSELYWRGPVFWTYDQTNWSARPGFEKRSTRMKSKLTGDKLDAQVREASRISMYDVTVFPHRSEWLYALDIPAFTPPSSYITEDWQLMNLNPVREMLTYKMMSFVEYRAGTGLTEDSRAMGLQLPQGEEPRTVALGRQLREQYGADSAEIARRARDMFDSGFEYDRGAPVIEGENPIDTFLFDTQQGYGMHFATAYALMMRGAGIPSRVVSGYHGGLYMFLIERVYVTQRDSHAWAEIWLDDYGWVRMDVARAALDMETGASNVPALSNADSAEEDAPTLAQADTQSEDTQPATERDAQENSGGHWLANFDAQSQGRMLEATGLRASVGALLLSGGAVAGALAILWGCWQLVRRYLRLRRIPPAQRMAERFCQALSQHGPKRKASEGLRSYVARVLETPEISSDQDADITGALDWLCRALYGQNAGNPPAYLLELRTQILPATLWNK